MTDQLVYKALRAEEVAPSEAAGVSCAAVDAADGYVHLSTREQLGETLARHFAGLTGVRLYAFEASRLGEALKWETSRGGALFPHLYAPLPLAGACGSWTLLTGPDGVPVVPEDV